MYRIASLQSDLFGQYSHFIPPENTKNKSFSGVFWGYKMGTLASNGLKTEQNV